MGTILALLVFLGGVIAAIAVGMRISVYFYMQNVLGTHPLTSDSNQPLTVERKVVERTGHFIYEESDAISSRYAWSGLAMIAGVVLLVVMAVISILSGVVH